MGLIAHEREDNFARSRHHYSRRIAAGTTDLIGSWTIVVLLFVVLALNVLGLQTQSVPVTEHHQDIVVSAITVGEGFSGLRMVGERAAPFDEGQ